MEVVEEGTVGGTVLAAVVADLTAMEVDAVVNAANVHLSHGGGVAAALSRAAGPSLQRESDTWVRDHGPLEVGQAAVTTGGNLPARWVVHVAGPVHGQGVPDDETHLRAVTAGALRAADDTGASSVAMPAISAGIYGYPPDEATAIIADATCVTVPDLGLDHVLLVGYDLAMAERFARGLRDALERHDR